VRYRARVEYDGTDFAGFQSQSRRRTVQGELETALARLGDGTRTVVEGAGRTDAGVHATGQVIAFTYTGRLSAPELEEALGGILPRDVAIREIRRVPAGFDPRRATRYREYRYTVWNGSRSPLHERTAFWVRNPLDVAAMSRAASALIGRHDFSAFGSTKGQPVRTVYAVRVRRQGSLVTIDVRADSFLRGQVRRMVGLLLEVGLARTDIDAVRSALADSGSAAKGPSAPAKGLCLRHVAIGRTTGNELNGEHEER